MEEWSAICGWMTSLSDLTRLRLLRLLERAELTVAELCTVLQAPQSTVSRHLKVLTDENWLKLRREGTSSWYRMPLVELSDSQGKLWQLVREQTATLPSVALDSKRLEQVLIDRQSRSQVFFTSAAGQWDKMRLELFGSRLDSWALAGLLDPQSIVGELGCGTALLSWLISPFVKQVIAIDSSAAMLDAARGRLTGRPNVRIEQGDLTRLPLQNNMLDLALLVLVLPYVSEPDKVLLEASRVLKSDGRLVVVDMMSHDRQQYQQEMGHVWLGFDQSQIEEWARESRLKMIAWSATPFDPDAKGPSLFVSRFSPTK